MLGNVGSDPFLLLAYGAVVAMAAAVWYQMRRRLLAHGGGWLAAAVVAFGILALLFTLAAPQVPIEIGLGVLFLGLVLLYRPDLVVRYTGGPKTEWLLLRDARRLELDLPSLAPAEARERVEALERYRTPDTAEFLDRFREVALAEDPDAPRIRTERRRLEELRAEMRADLGARPTWERELAGPGESERPF